MRATYLRRFKAVLLLLINFTKLLLRKTLKLTTVMEEDESPVNEDYSSTLADYGLNFFKSKNIQQLPARLQVSII